MSIQKIHAELNAHFHRRHGFVQPQTPEYSQKLAPKKAALKEYIVRADEQRTLCG